MPAAIGVRAICVLDLHLSQIFNATSLREANRSTTMNRYVIIFTVVTVIFLPPTFTSVSQYLCSGALGALTYLNSVRLFSL